MNQKQLLTYAILTVNDGHNKDYYDNFVPFVKEVLRRANVETISANDVKDRLKTMFQLDLPINVINTILKKRLRPNGYLKYEKRSFKPNYEKLNETHFEENRIKILEKHERLINDLVLFTKQQYNLDVDNLWAEKALGNFIDSNQISILAESIRKTSVKEKLDTTQKDLIIVSSYIKKIRSDYSILYDYLIEVVKGNMLVNAIYYTEPDVLGMYFKGTEVYFDTSFIIYALGFSGEARKEPCSELLLMLKESKAILQCFRHNVDEIIGILEWCKNNLTASHADIHGTISNFLGKGYSSSDVERIIYNIDEEIQGNLKIKIIEEPPFDKHEFVISEEELTTFLSSRVKYLRENALAKDVQSTSAIMRLRRGKKSFHIEDSRAFFVTTNYNFAQSVHEFFFNEELPKLIPPVLHDSVITNLVWLKNPSKAPNLPSKRLMADCYAAVAPKEHLWERYIETLNIYEKTGDITYQDLAILRYTQGAKELLVEKTLGEEDAVTIGTVQEILKEIKQGEEKALLEVKKEKDLEIMLLQEELNAKKEEMAMTLEERKKNILNLANARAKYSVMFIVSLPLLFIAYLLYIAPFIQNFNIPSIFKGIILLFATVILPMSGLFGFNILGPIAKLQERLAEFYEKRIERKYY
ncbi:hypothetical protein WAX78_00645 [Bacillus sp. FJAT-53711]|uniref:Uncharacterized protein n=1 Tax=Bacillus yunxiaonensis TaxID=3127665 RepID=A0ABU8FSP0_9BACI